MEMVEELDIRDPHGDMLRITRPGTMGVFPKNSFGTIKVAVCPQCGYAETYLSNLDKIRQYERDR